MYIEWPSYLESVDCSWFQLPVALLVIHFTFLFANGEVLHLDGAVVEGVIGLHNLLVNRIIRQCSILIELHNSKIHVEHKIDYQPQQY